MHEDDDFGRAPTEPRRPQEPSREDQRRTAAARAYDEEQKLDRENIAREFLRTSKVFGGMLAAHNVDDEYTKKFVIDAAAKDIAENRTKGELSPQDLGRLISAAVEKGKLEQEKFERERDAASDLRRGPDRSQSQQLDKADQNSRAFFESGKRRTERQNQTAQPLGKYRQLEELSRRDDPHEAVVSRQQREDSDRRQSIDPATRTSNERGRPLGASEARDSSHRAENAGAHDRPARGDERPRDERPRDDRGDRSGQNDRGNRGGNGRTL